MRNLDLSTVDELAQQCGVEYTRRRLGVDRRLGARFNRGRYFNSGSNSHAKCENARGPAMMPVAIARASLRTLLAAGFFALVVLPVSSQQRAPDRWVATWATALVARPLPAPGGGPGGPGGPPPANTGAAGASCAAPPPTPPTPPPAAPSGNAGPPRFPPPATVTNQTLRQIVHTSLGGDRVRVVLSNAYGTAPLEIGAADVALRDKGAAVVAASVKPLTFAGKPKATILPGATLVSDPVGVKVAPLSDLVIDLYLPGDLGVSPSPVTTHNGASQTNYLSETGDHTGEPALKVAAQTGAWFLLARVEVPADANTRAVVTFGDSITDGARSTVDTNSRWPDRLAQRLAAQRGGNVAVLNAGISGNRVLGDGAGISALARFDRDVLMQTGVTHVVVMEGINDIGVARNNATPSADDLIAGHKQLIERAHARGLKIIGATLTPYDGAAYCTPEGEAKRLALNQWIRTSGAYDGVIDFDKATRDAAAPSKFASTADSGDHLHPGDAGYKTMADSIDLALFR
jgi:lysophospholipase L1-like esterase